jgi:hypothetical protein
MTMAKSEYQQDMFDAHIIPSRLAITAMRDSGYKNTAYALAELIDNAQQAGASVIEVLCFQKRERIQQRERSRISQIAVLDNGSGMDSSTMRMALQFGNGRYLNDRSGIGRFGMGLPNASISQAGRVELWSWQNGPDNALYSYLDIGEIQSGEMQVVPAPVHDPVPDEWRDISEHVSTSGTLVVWSNLDIHRLTWKSAKATLLNTERLAGRIYRRFIRDGSIRIRLFAQEEGGDVVYDEEATFDDPLYLTPSPLVPAPFDQEPMFDHVFDEEQKIEYNGAVHTVKVRYSVAKRKTVELAGTQNRGDMPYGQHAKRNIGVSVIRVGRELMLDQGWCIGYDPRERWWGAEVEFPPALDELFGVTNNKQAATHFAELATIDWQQLAEEDEEFIDVVNRLKDEGDPRGYLLTLADSIKRNLKQLRDSIKSQGSGTRSTRRKRHDEPDDLTSTVDQRWKDRSRERPIEGEDQPRTEEDFREIKDDLTENKKYPEPDAEALVSLIRDADLRVVFLEADFPDPYQLFSVEMKGNVTEITFNRKHPAFDDIFGTVNTVDEDVNDLSREEILERLMRAINAAKVVFAAWARYEREAGVDRARALQKVRFEWGQIAAKFLDPDDDLTL